MKEWLEEHREMVDRIIESVEWVDSFAAWSQWLWNEMERLAYEDWHEEQQDAEIELLNQKLEALYGESVDAYRAEAAENRRQIERLVELNEWQAAQLEVLQAGAVALRREILANRLEPSLAAATRPHPAEPGAGPSVALQVA